MGLKRQLPLLEVEIFCDGLEERIVQRQMQLQKLGSR